VHLMNMRLIRKKLYIESLIHRKSSLHVL